MNINLIKGDCLERMKDIPDKSIDMILCDLPYGTTRNKWDNIISFDELWGEYNRIIKDEGVIILFAQGMFTSQLMFSQKNLWRYNLIWEKDRPSGFLNAKKMPLRSHEDICVFYKKTPTYNPIFWEGKPLHGMGQKYKEGNLANNNYGDFKSHKNPSANRQGDTKKYPRSVLKFSKEHPPIHPTQKPVALLEYLIKTYTNKRQVVLDNCMGSGSTGIACLSSDRNFIGIELDDSYFDVATNRINTYIKDNNLENIELNIN